MQGAELNVDCGQEHMGHRFADFHNDASVYLRKYFKNPKAVAKHMRKCRYDWIGAYLRGMSGNQAAQQTLV